MQDHLGPTKVKGTEKPGQLQNVWAWYSSLCWRLPSGFFPFGDSDTPPQHPRIDLV